MLPQARPEEVQLICRKEDTTKVQLTEAVWSVHHSRAPRMKADQSQYFQRTRSWPLLAASAATDTPSRIDAEVNGKPRRVHLSRDLHHAPSDSSLVKTQIADQGRRVFRNQLPHQSSSITCFVGGSTGGAEIARACKHLPRHPHEQAAVHHRRPRFHNISDHGAWRPELRSEITIRAA